MRFVLVIAALLALGFAAACDDDADDGEGVQCDTDIELADAIPTVTGTSTVTASCIQIIDVQVGDGEEVATGATVTVHYTGYLEDGTTFDSSVGGDPATFPLTGVIQGWQDGIPGMKVGGKRRLIIPPELGYGEAGAGEVIPPNATLIFDVELIEIPE